jgi:DNA-binding GntR family transcriptional regulator
MEVLNLTANVLRVLREKIIIGEFKPGCKLNELDIANSLGISRPPLREAFRILENDRMVVNIPRKGTFVSELSVVDFISVTQAREMVECFSVDLLKALNIRNLPNVTLALDKSMSLPLPFSKLDQIELLNRVNIVLDFHANLVKSAGNSILIHIYNSIGYTLARYQFIYFHILETAEHSLNDHKKILQLINDGNFDQAKKELKEHIMYTVDVVKSRILRVIF